MERICTIIFPCAECKKEFTSRGSLHKHLKQHGLNLASYYTKYHPRINKLTGDPLPFKRYEEYFERDFYNGSDDYTSSGYSSVLESGALHLDTDNEKMLQRVTVEYSGVSALAVTAAMKFGKASQPDQLLSGLNYKLLSTTETLDDQSEASTADRISDRINPDDKAYFNLYTRGRYLGYQLRLTGDGPATITRITLSTRLAEK